MTSGANSPNLNPQDINQLPNLCTGIRTVDLLAATH